MGVIRYADDTIVGSQYQADADRLLENLRERLAMFGLEYTRIRRAGSKSGGMPKRDGNEEEKGNRDVRFSRFSALAWMTLRKR